MKSLTDCFIACAQESATGFAQESEMGFAQESGILHQCSHESKSSARCVYSACREDR